MIHLSFLKILLKKLLNMNDIAVTIDTYCSKLMDVRNRYLCIKGDMNMIFP
jgi:hypothetical protein